MRATRRSARPAAQLALGLVAPAAQKAPARGGFRKGAGRKRVGKRACVPHVERPAHVERHPVHVTLRARRDVGNLRQQSVLRALVARFARSSEREFRVVHFSVQTDHLHLIVEALDADVLVRKMTGLTTWIAREVNGLRGRRGAFWADRYHRRDLKTPRETRNVLLYVLQNRRKHLLQRTGRDVGGVDAYSSAAWLVGGWEPDAEHWLRSARRTFERALGPPATPAQPVAAPRSWLARVGWLRAKPGPLRLSECPAI